MATVPSSFSTQPCLVCGMATPRPMPVEPRLSRFWMARTTSSVSAEPFSAPAARRLSTISRITSSFVVALRSGRMASRTTKSDMRMAGLSLLAGLLGLRGGSKLARGGVAPVVLDLLFIATELHLELVLDDVDGPEQVDRLTLGDEIVLV